jgi:hypothetical protein
VDLRATVVGDNPSDVERLAWNVQVAEYGRPGEVACWDPLGQARRADLEAAAVVPRGRDAGR